MNATARIAVLGVALTACAPAWKQAPHDRRFQKAAPPALHAQPKAVRTTDWWDMALHSTVLPVARLVSPAAYWDALVGVPPALDVNSFGEVPDSEWFTNRIGRRRLTPREIERGPDMGGPPADGLLTVISGKTEGITPGMVVRDSSGTVWFVKFDPPAYPELSTGAEIIATRLLWAAGYHVPEVHIVQLDTARLRIAPTATRRDDYNRRVRFTKQDLDTLLLHLNLDLGGRIRALFSRGVPGTPIGPFSYRGTRGDDPNDRLPHERRRSLRGLRLFSSWLNNTDTRKQNTLDTFIPVAGKRGRGFVRHFLIDFGDALGATGSRAKLINEGYEYRVPWREIGKNVVALGFRYPYWLRVLRSPYREVGVFEAEVYDPRNWYPEYPNPAFRYADARDRFWAASILARFDDEHVLAAVSEADYSKAAAADWVFRVLMKRRVKLLRWAFSEMLALAEPRVEDGYRVALTDLEVKTGLVEPRSGYDWSIRWNRTGRGDVELASGSEKAPRVDARGAVTRVMTEHAAGFRADPYLTLSVWRPLHGRRGPRVEIHLRVVRDHILVVGIEREVKRWGAPRATRAFP